MSDGVDITIGTLEDILAEAQYSPEDCAKIAKYVYEGDISRAIRVIREQRDRIAHLERREREAAEIMRYSVDGDDGVCPVCEYLTEKYGHAERCALNQWLEGMPDE